VHNIFIRRYDVKIRLQYSLDKLNINPKPFKVELIFALKIVSH
jgi:hypothetical protein